jgi:hypothetical protein
MLLESEILSEITTFLKYAKYIPEKQRRETWTELVDRNKEMHIARYPLLRDEIENAYKLVYEKKVLPSMRSMQFAGKPIDLNNTRIFNCSYLPMDHPDAFSEVMFLLLSGVGVGYSVQSHHVEKLPTITKPTKTRRYLVGDSIEGWSDAVKVLISAYMRGKSMPVFDFRDIRPKGAMLITSGGKAPGPEPLKDALHNIQKILDRKQNGEQLTTLEVHDINCFIADAVLAGGIRRCLPKFYSVRLSNGEWKSIADLAVGDEVLYNGTSYPIQNVFTNGVQELVKINLEDGTWHCSTPNHRWLVMNHGSGQMEWMEASVVKKMIENNNKISFVMEE